MALGISAAAGSFGQFAMLPATQWLLSNLGWYGALIALGCIGLAIVPLAAALVERNLAHDGGHRQSIGEAVQEAFSHRGYILLTIGFFVCGFQVVFVGVHLPSYLADRGMPPHVAVTALALVSHGRSLPVGAFLNPADRESFAGALGRALAVARSGGPVAAGG